MNAASGHQSARLQQWLEQVRHADLLGHRIAFWSSTASQQQRPALLLIHGFPTSAYDWQPLWEPLSARFQLIAPDLLGFGLSAKPAGHRYTLIEQADLVEALLAQLGQRQVHVLAHDYGDSVAQELLARHTARAPSGGSAVQLQSIVFLNGGLFPERHRPRPIQKLLASPIGFLVALGLHRKRFGTSFSAVFGPTTQPTEAELDDFWSLISLNKGHRIGHRLIAYVAERKIHRERWIAAMRSSRVPLRFINGLLDPISGAQMVARYQELIPRADIVELPDVGHYPQLEATQRVLDAAAAFWNRLKV